MPINRLFRDGDFKPEDVERLNRAFAFALSTLGLVDRNDPICEIVAHKVIAIDATGTQDPKEIGMLPPSSSARPEDRQLRRRHTRRSGRRTRT